MKGRYQDKKIYALMFQNTSNISKTSCYDSLNKKAFEEYNERNINIKKNNKKGEWK